MHVAPEETLRGVIIGYPGGVDPLRGFVIGPAAVWSSAWGWGRSGDGDMDPKP